MRLYWRKQPEDRDSCGQVALAVVLNVPYKQAVRLVGHEGPTKTRELVTVLREHGYDCPDRCRVMERPPLALAKLRIPEIGWYNWHWVVVHGEKVYDGVHGTRAGKTHWPRGAKITSFLPIST